MAEINIPRLDLNYYVNGSAEQKKQFSENIGKAFPETGFVTIANHGMTQELMNELYVEVKKFFDLPEDVKRKYEKPELAGQRGYTSKGKERRRVLQVYYSPCCESTQGVNEIIKILCSFLLASKAG